LWECTVPGLATTDRAVVEQHLRDGRQGQWEAVPVTTLAAVCGEHRSSGEIHFLKIDVEGGEESVLRGADFRRFRPWIVVVEATRPNSTQQKHESWEHLLTGADYRFAYADGLNRFYLAREHEELAAAFAYPPNIFDQFIVAQQFNAELWRGRAEQGAQQQQEMIDRLDARLRDVAQSAALAEQRAADMAAHARESEQRAREAQRRADEAAARAAQMLHVAHSAQRSLATREAQLEQARAMIDLLRASTSWRVTRPLRWISGLIKGERAATAAAPPPATAAPARGARAARRTGRGTVPEDAVLYLPARARSAYQEMKAAAQDASKAR